MSKSDAKAFAAKSHYPKGYKIVGVQVSKSGFNTALTNGHAYCWDALDGFGGARYVDIEVIDQVVKRIWTVL